MNYIGMLSLNLQNCRASSAIASLAPSNEQKTTSSSSSPLWLDSKMCSYLHSKKKCNWPIKCKLTNHIFVGTTSIKNNTSLRKMSASFYPTCHLLKQRYRPHLTSIPTKANTLKMKHSKAATTSNQSSTNSPTTFSAPEPVLSTLNITKSTNS